MKTNEALGFTPVETAPFNHHTRGGDVTFTLASKGGAWRAYGYRWHSEQDASREHKISELCARGNSADQAIENFREAASKAGWPIAAVTEATQDMLDQVA